MGGRGGLGSSTLSLFSPKRPLLRPSRLTSSWVAGGYWTSPAQQQTQPGTISRSSSQSSGFVSATPSLNNFNNSAAPSLNNFFPAPSQQGSVLNFPQTSLANFHRAESDRFSLASEPLSARSPISRTHHLTQRHHQQLVCNSPHFILTSFHILLLFRTACPCPATRTPARLGSTSQCTRWQQQHHNLSRSQRAGPSQ